jgi:hypothetical protein
LSFDNRTLMQTDLNRTPWRDSNPGSSFLEADAMTIMPLCFITRCTISVLSNNTSCLYVKFCTWEWNFTGSHEFCTYDIFACIYVHMYVHEIVTLVQNNLLLIFINWVSNFYPVTKFNLFYKISYLCTWIYTQVGNQDSDLCSTNTVFYF